MTDIHTKRLIARKTIKKVHGGKLYKTYNCPYETCNFEYYVANVVYEHYYDIHSIHRLSLKNGDN